jgi:hypothetical protein
MSDYWSRDRFSQAEKKQEVIRDTFLSRAQAEADLLNSGRFAKETATSVVGTTPSAPYPQQPSTSPWSQPDRNPEPPFDQDISAVEPILTEPTPDPETAQHLTVSDAATASLAGDAVSATKGGGPAVSYRASSQPSRRSFRRF